MYYNLEKAAEVLGISPGDLNRLRESGKMRAFRDGADWKFRKDDVDGYLTEQIKNRSKASAEPAAGGGDSDLLNESEDELPTMLADSKSFESLVSANPDVIISSRDETENGLMLDEAPEPESPNVLDGDTPKGNVKLDGGSSGISLVDDDLERGSASGISLIDDDDIQLGGGASASGISLVDDDALFEVGGSNVDLGQENIILGDASGSGLNLGGASGITLGSLSSGGSGSGISLLSDDDNLFSLDQEATHQKGSAAQPSKKEPEIFSLAEENSAENESTELAGDSFQLAPEEEDFQLAPIGTGDEDSDSESSSQVIALDDENMFMTDDGTDAGGGVYGLAGAEQKAAATPPAAPAAVAAGETQADQLGLDLNAEMPTFDLGDDLAPPDFNGQAGGFDMGDGGFGAPGASALPPEPTAAPDLTPTDSFDGFGTQNAGGFGIPGVGETPVTGGCSYAAGRGCMQESHYSGLSILLGLAPCILVLILAGIGAYELIRTIWSWDQPFGLTGSVLETIGGLINLI